MPKYPTHPIFETEKLSYPMLRKVSSILLILITGLIILNKASFTHTHILADGTVITHAHPFEKSATDPEGSHEHTNWEYAFLHNLDALIPLIMLGLTALFLFREKKFYTQNDTTFTTAVVRVPSGRAPPFFSTQ